MEEDEVEGERERGWGASSQSVAVSHPLLFKLRSVTAGPQIAKSEPGLDDWRLQLQHSRESDCFRDLS